MKCPKCNTKNVIKANYCKKCKYHFTEEDQEKAYNKTIFHFFDVIEEWYGHLTLDTITGHILFKIGSVLVVLAIGLYYWFTMGINTRILKSDIYDVYQNKKNKEYYIVLKDNIDDIEDIKLNMYIPNRLKKLDINQYDLDNNLKEKVDSKNKEEMKFKVYNDDYYLITSVYSNKKSEDLKIYIYRKSDIEEGV